MINNAELAINEEPLEPRDVRSRPSCIRSSRWVTIGTLVCRPLQFCFNVSLARILGPAALGLLNLAQSTASSLAGIAQIGLDGAANKFTAEFYRRDPSMGRRLSSLIIFTSGIFSSIFFLLAWLSSPIWGYKIFPASVSLAEIGACLLLGWVSVQYAIGQSLLTGLQLFREIALILFLQTGVIFFSGLILGQFFGFPGAMAGYIAGSLACVFYGIYILWRFDKNIFRWPAKFLKQDFNRIFNFSMPTWLGAFIINPITSLSYAWLAHQPRGAYELGFFSTATTLKNMLGVLAGIVYVVIGPAIIEEGGDLGNRASYERLLHHSLIAMGFLVIPPMIGLLFWRDWAFMLYGHAYARSVDAFVPLLGVGALSAIVTPGMFAMVAKDRIWRLQVFSLGQSLLLILFAYVSISRFLSAGLAWSLISAQLIFVIGLEEYCVAMNIMPASTRRVFYGFLFWVGVMLGLAILLPSRFQHILALPATLGSAIFIVRRYPEVMAWLIAASPEFVRPWIRKYLKMLQ